jgi:hypothetical protein
MDFQQFLQSTVAGQPLPWLMHVLSNRWCQEERTGKQAYTATDTLSYLSPSVPVNTLHYQWQCTSKPKDNYGVHKDCS